ncbi:MAG: hypothetical protein A2Y33_13030 [Spirochaetes bacterium GWF1_51_8]|nr:MAG: hypothetical protein A2Y33_13030 [Spirochaetes bacterium GWF1_51_8]
MIHKELVFDIPFRKYQMGRIDSFIDEEISNNSLEKGVVKITAPEGVILTSIEYEEDLVKDFTDAFVFFNQELEKSIDPYILSKMPKNALTVPYNVNRLVIGDWQQIVFFALQDIESLTIKLDFYKSHSILGLESIETTSELQTFDITDIIQRTLMNSHNDNVTLVSPSESAIIYTLYPDKYKSLVSFLETVAPKNKEYYHAHSWERSEVAHSHIRSSFISQILTLTTANGVLDLKGERLFLTELDTMPRRRDIYFEIWKEHN